MNATSSRLLTNAEYDQLGYKLGDIEHAASDYYDRENGSPPPSRYIENGTRRFPPNRNGIRITGLFDHLADSALVKKAIRSWRETFHLWDVSQYVAVPAKEEKLKEHQANTQLFKIEIVPDVIPEKLYQAILGRWLKDKYGEAIPLCHHHLIQSYDREFTRMVRIDR